MSGEVSFPFEHGHFPILYREFLYILPGECPLLVIDALAVEFELSKYSEGAS